MARARSAASEWNWRRYTWNYFNGQISDVAYYTQPLSAGQVGFLNQAGRHASSLLTSITRPSGAVQAKIAYEPLTGRVYTVTDNNGGAWTVEPPSVAGSSQVFRSAVMAAAPAGYWRMSDPAGSANAASQMASDGLYASYSNVTLGQTGVFADSTVAGFNGTSSYLRLPDQSISAASGAPASIGLWFKTSASGAQILVGTTHDLPGGSPGSGAMPVMYVGTDGKLHAHYWNGNVADLSTAGAVNDGKWHEAVLTTSGTSQLLYVDGVSVTSTPLNGTTQNYDPYNFVGAGVFNTNPWPAGPSVSSPTWSYFNGSIGDFSYFRSQLTGTQVVQMWTASQNSSGVSPVLAAKAVDPTAPVTKIPFDGTTYSATSPKIWDLPGVRLTLQGDGNLVAYRNYNVSNGTGTAFWATGTNGNPNAVLAFQTDGNMVVYADATKTRALWMSNTNAPQATGNYALFEPDGGLTIYKQDNSLLWSVASPTTSAPGVTITQMDPNAGNRELADTDAAGVGSTYGYDTSGYLNTVTDGDGNTVTTGHDVRGNQVSRTTCQVQYTNACSTEYYTYWPDDVTSQLTPDPRNDLVTSHRDGRSASASDNTYLTSYTYDAYGNQTSVTTPPVQGFPNGRTSTTSYTTGSTTAADSGTTPPGLVAKKTTDAGLATVTTYFHNGDVAQTTDAAGLVTKYTYDNLGRMLTKTSLSDSYPSGLVTGYISDGMNRVTQETNPAVTDRVTGAIHTAVTTTTYDADGNVTRTQAADTTGGDASRVTSSHFNALDQQDSLTDAAGNITRYGYDAHGYRNKAVNANGVETDTAYDADGHVLSNTLVGYTGDPVSPSAATNLVTSSEAYDPAGRLASVTDANGNLSKYAYTDNGLISSITRYDANGQNPYVLQSNTYDAAGNLLSRSTHNGTDTTTHQVDAATRVASSTVDPNGVNRTTTFTYSPDDVVTAINDRDGSGWNRTTTYGLDAVGRQTSKTVHASANGNGPAAAAGQVGSWPLGDGQSTTAADASGNGYTGTLSGGTSWSTDHGGTAVFDGSTGTIATAQPVVDTSKSFSVATWVKLNTVSPTANQTVVVQQGQVNSGFYLEYNSGQNGWTFTRVGADAANPGTYYYAKSTAPPTAGTWYHLVGVFDATTGISTLYVNSAAQGSSAADTTPFNATGPLVIGRGWHTGTQMNWVNGEVGTTKVFNRALSVLDVQNLYNGQPKAQPQNGLAAQWNMTDGNVGTAADTSGSNNTGTLSGGVSWSTDHGGSAAFDGATGAIATTKSVLDTTKSFSVAAWVNLTSTANWNTAVSQDGTQNSGFNLQYDLQDNKWNFARAQSDVVNTPGSFRALSTSPPTLNTWTHLVGTFDQSTGTMKLYVNGAAQGTAVDTSPFATSGSLAIGRAKWNGSNADPFHGKVSGVQVYNRVLSATEVSSLYGGGSLLPADATTTTSWTLDARGLATSATDANGNVTTYVNDEAGHKVVTSAPSVPVETGGGAAVQAHPVSTVGYNTFGETVETQDPDGNVVTTAYDADGNVASVTQPNYTPPGSITAITAVTQNTYDKLGNLLSTKDPVGNTTSYAYDQRSLTATVTAPDTSVTHTTYDNNGELLSVTDGNGATTQATWDYLGRKATSTHLERYPTAASYTTRYAYDANGWPQKVTSPTGVVTQTHYNNVGELSWSMDGANNKTTYGYDFLGDAYLTTLPDGTSTETDYNALQKPYQTIKRDAAGIMLTKTSSVLDGNGNPQSTHRRPQHHHHLPVRRVRHGHQRNPTGHCERVHHHIVRIRRRRQPHPLHRRQRQQVDHHIQQLGPARVLHRTGHQPIHRR